MIDRQALLSDLQTLVRRIEADLIARSDSSDVPEVAQSLRDEYDRARKSDRTARTLKQWIEETATQHAAAWVLSCVFIRFLEDNQLIAAPKLSGPGDRRDWARDEHELYFRKFPTHSDRDYLLHIFDELAGLPATRDVFGPHNPLRDLPQWLGPDVAGELVQFFLKFDPNTGLLIHDFTDPDWDTRFLGDLYQDLSEAARKNFALLQTPVFVEEFILDRTLEPALDEFGLQPSIPEEAAGVFRMIDPACGSGHFLLGAFPRLLDRWQQSSPGTPVAQLVQKALDSIHGVDLNPYAVAITRFRLLLAALKACGETKLSGAPEFSMNLACGDSLYHGRQRQQHLGDWTDETHTFQTEDAAALRRILREGTYHCVVANPPYITPKDKAANQIYRGLYSSCHRQYSLAVPFMERIFRLAVAGNGHPAGYTGQITANSYMKREFGKKLIEQFLPKVDLTHVVDTSGAYIPGHGTPTVILFGRHRKPQSETIRTVMGIRGEPSTPDDPARGLVWSAIMRMIDNPAGDDNTRHEDSTSRDQLTSRARKEADQTTSVDQLTSHDDLTSRDREGAEPAPTSDESTASLRARLVDPTTARLVGPQPQRGEQPALPNPDLDLIGYFITFTTYGTWLHGDQRGSVDRNHNLPEERYLGPDPQREQREFADLKHDPVQLDNAQRQVVHEAIEEVCTHRGWRLHALNVRTNHVHVVLHADRPPERVMNDFKSYATRRLVEQQLFAAGQRAWTRHGSTRYLNDEDSLARAVHYTLHEQGGTPSGHVDPTPHDNLTSRDDGTSRARKEADHTHHTSRDQLTSRDDLTSHEALTSRDREGADPAPTSERSTASLRARLVKPATAPRVDPATARPVTPQPQDHEFVSVADVPRERFGKHPWSIGGGGAAELKEKLEKATTETLGARSESIGFASFTGQDEAFVADAMSLQRVHIPRVYIKEFVVGDTVRDWAVMQDECAFAPYDDGFTSIELNAEAAWARHMWLMRTAIGSVKSFGGKTRLECGDKWWTWYRWVPEKYRTPLSIVFAFVATHNHFVLDRGGKVFNRSAPVIKLPEDATEEDHLALLGLLNSSTACFWMKQVFFPKGGDHVGQEGARVRRTLWDERYEFAGTGLQGFPIASATPLRQAPSLDTLAQRLATHAGTALLERLDRIDRESLDAARQVWRATRREMIALQEDLDWDCYRLYGLIDEDLAWYGDVVPIELGQRAFEIVMARKMAAGTLQTTWFERHGSTPMTDIPDDWPEEYRRLVQRRIEVIEQNPEIRLIEQPEYKRRWNMPAWDRQLADALRLWLTDRLESYFDFDGRMNDEGIPTAKFDDQLVSVTRIADEAGRDEQFLEVGALYRDDIAFDVQKLVAELVAAESVPLLPVLRYKPAGLRKRKQWEETWELQRREDAGEEVGDIPVPPKYKSSDFISTGGARYWALRGKLDVPKERWISFPHCAGEDGSLVVCWAGYDHLQQARAISGYFVEIQEQTGGRDDPRLEPLLAGIVELLPWLRQWHDETDPEFGMSLADYFDGFVTEEARTLGRTQDDLRAWQPPKKTGRGRSKKQNPRSSADR